MHSPLAAHAEQTLFCSWSEQPAVLGEDPGGRILAGGAGASDKAASAGADQAAEAGARVLTGGGGRAGGLTGGGGRAGGTGGGVVQVM